MLKKFLLSGAALAMAFAGAPATAQTAPASPPAAAAAPAATVETKDADPALWVVKDKDTTIYLFGTVHVLKPGLGWFDEAVRAAFDKSDLLMIEMVEPDPTTLQGILTRLAFNAEGPTVTEQLPEDKRAAYAAAMEAAGMPVAMFEKFDPWFSALVITMGALPKLGYDPNLGAEKILTTAAKDAGKPIGGLETAEQQMGYFDGLDAKTQVAYLVSTIDQAPTIGKTLDTMVENWAAGDPVALAKTMNESMTDPVIYRVLLSERNERWADWIAERMKQPGTVFIAVGAGHLAGKDSVQDYLKKKRLKAVRVNY